MEKCLARVTQKLGEHDVNVNSYLICFHMGILYSRCTTFIFSHLDVSNFRLNTLNK